jgi:hypothetical protein
VVVAVEGESEDARDMVRSSPGTRGWQLGQVKVGQTKSPPRPLALERQARCNEARRSSRGRQEVLASGPGMLDATVPSRPLPVGSSNTGPHRSQQCRQCKFTTRAARTLAA